MQSKNNKKTTLEKEKKPLVDFTLLPVVVLNDPQKPDINNSEIFDIILKSQQVIIVTIGYTLTQSSHLKSSINKLLTNRGWGKNDLDNVCFVTMIDGWFNKIQVSSDEDKMWFTMTHIYYDIIQVKNEYKNKRFTHIFWSFNPFKNNIKRVYDRCFDSYKRGEQKLLFKNKSEGMPENFCTYMFGQNFITLDMYKNNESETYKEVITDEV
jgi:hypothetical protein